MGLEPVLQVLLKQHFGFSEFRPGQENVIQALFENKAALAVFPMAQDDAARSSQNRAAGAGRFSYGMRP